MRRRLLLPAVAACVLVPFVPVTAGTQLPAGRRAAADTAVRVGARVRVSVASAFRQSPFGARADRVQGMVRAIARDTLYVELANVVGGIAIPRSSIRRVEVSRGVSRWPRALKWGAIGAAFFGLSMWAEHEDPKTRRYDEAWQAAGVGGAIGFGFGAWLGGRRPHEHWRAARLPRDSAQ